MKKALVLSSTLLLLILSSATLFALAPFPRHVDPLQVPEEKTSLELLMLYSQIGGHALQLNFSSAFKTLSNASLAYVPEDLRYIFGRFNSLLNETLSDMNTTRYDLALCRALIGSSKLGPAEDSLNSALKNLAISKIDYDVLEDSSRELSRHVPAEPISQALLGVEGGISKLELEAESLKEMLFELRPKLLDVRLQISVEPRSVVFGQNFSVSGFLLGGDGSALGDRRIILHVGGKGYGLETLSDGSYQMLCPAREYSMLKVYAEYFPYGGDVGVYSYGISDIILVNVTYYVPPLKLSLSSDRLLPQETLTLKVDTLPGFPLEVETPLGKVSGISDVKGFFTYNLTLPSDIKEGSYTVSASTPSRDVFASASVSESFTVYRLETYSSLHAPSLVFTGVPFTVEIESSTNSTVNFNIEELKSGSSYHGLRFSRTITLPLTFLSGSLSLSAEIVPDNPSYKSVHVASKVTVVNSLAILLPIALLTFFSTRLFRRRIETQLPPEVLGELEARVEPGPRSPLQSLFFELLGFLEKLSRTAMKPSDTLREYLSKVESKLQTQIRAFVRRIFEGYERLVYGRPEDGLEASLSRALRELLEELKKVLP